jgi:hypothetical protein
VSRPSSPVVHSCRHAGHWAVCNPIAHWRAPGRCSISPGSSVPGGCLATCKGRAKIRPRWQHLTRNVGLPLGGDHEQTVGPLDQSDGSGTRLGGEGLDYRDRHRFLCVDDGQGAIAKDVPSPVISKWGLRPQSRRRRSSSLIRRTSRCLRGCDGVRRSYYPVPSPPSTTPSIGIEGAIRIVDLPGGPIHDHEDPRLCLGHMQRVGGRRRICRLATHGGKVH